MPTLSVVIPAMNEEKYLPRLFACIEKQTRKPDEIIVADAGSTDSTRQIAERFGAKIVQGGLPGPGRNAGARVATGELIFFLDGDVYLPDEHFFEYALKEFVDRGLDVATADLLFEDGTKLDKFGHHLYNGYVRAWGSMRPHAPGACILVKKSAHDKVNGFDPSVLFCEDQDYVRRISAFAKFGFLNSVQIGMVNRRLEKEGRASLLVKYLLADLHIMFLGPIRHNWFKYEFGYKEKETP